MRVIQDLHKILAHWNYSPEEWNEFLRWQQQRKGFMHYAWHLIFRQRNAEVPEITITGQRIWTNNDAESFMDNSRKLRKILIRDTGRFNILQISYEKLSGNEVRQQEIRIPVPKGKLKEAIEVQESLDGYTI